VQAVAGTGSLILLGGDAGMGKTALARTAAAAADGFLVMTGACPGPGETPPFGVWPEACLSRVVGAQPKVAALNWLAGLSRPVLLVIEDLQWADPASCELLTRVTERLSTAPVVVLATYGSDELHRKAPFTASLPWLRQHCAASLQLQPFGPEDLGALAARCGAPRGQRLTGMRCPSPLLATELLYEPQDLGPCTSAKDLFSLRLARLGAAVRELVEAAAVLGQRFSRRLLATMSGLSVREVSAGLAEATACRLIRPAGESYSEFVHATAREAALEGLILPRRRRFHVQAADALLGRSTGDPFRIGLHLHRGGDPRAADYLMLAADTARRAGALAQAEQLYEYALEWLPEPGPRRRCCLCKLCLTLRCSGQPGRARSCYEEVTISKMKG
jgi:hypothetical protein